MASSPLDYYERLKRVQQQRAVEADPVAATVAAIRANDTRDTILNAPPPDQVARTTKIARSTGESPALIDGREDEVERAQQANLFTDMLVRFPTVAKWAQGNPRGVAAAADDHKALGILGDAWEFIKKAGTRIEGGSYLGGAGIRQLTDPIAEAGGFVNALVQAPIQTVLDAGGINKGYDPFAANRRFTVDNTNARNQMRTEAERLRQTARGGSWLADTSLQAFESLPLTIAAMLTRNPELATAIPASSVAGNAYNDAKVKGLRAPDAMRYAVSQGFTEYVTERGAAFNLLADIANKTPFGKTLLKQLATEIPGEQIATVVQDFTEWATLNPDKPFSSYVAARPEAALATLVQTAVGTSVQTAAVKATEATVEAASKVAGRVVQAREAKRQEAFLAQVERAAAESKLRGRDPVAYADLVEQSAQQSGVDQAFIPAEAIRAFQQSDTYDQFDDPFADYQDQIDEAFEVGGDVVLPAGFALGTLPGTAAWAAVKSDMRLTPGGMSAREADDLSSQLDNVMAELTDQAYQRDADQQGERDARGQIVERVSAMLQNAGFTPANARMQAELIAQKESTRATRMGRDLTGAEFGTEVVSVLPPALAAIQKADSLDLVVNALRKGKPATVQRGKSLLEWIAARGGVEDTGGDIASMGGDKWHKGKVGKRKLLKPSTAAQGSMIGGEFNPNTVENTLDAAISEGFFPELLAQRETGEGYADKIDTGVLLAAISDELAGRSIFAEEATTDNVRAAAAELEQMLAERGLVASELTDAEIRAAVGQMEQEGSGGVVYDQLPDSIDIDGVARPTRNSEGMPLAGSEEGLRAFWKWFGDSKVVDEEGRPLVVYHGTNQPIDQFSPDRLGMSTRSESANYGYFFTSDPYVAGLYANSAASKTAPDIDRFERESADLQKKVERLEKQAVRTGNWDAYEAAMMEWETLEIDAMRADDSGQNIVPVYLAVSDPVVLDFEGEGILKLDGGFGAAIKAARDGGRGGLFLKNIDDTPGETRVSDHYVTFEATQIKSINNRGTFDPADARILYQSGDNASIALNALAREGNDKAIIVQALVDGLGLRVEQLSNILVGITSASEANSLSGVEALSPMLSLMRGIVLHEGKVLDAIIKSIPVNVVNNLGGSQGAAKVALHDEAMLKDGSAFDAELPVSVMSDRASAVRLLVRETARVATEGLGEVMNSRRELVEGDSTVGARKFSQEMSSNPRARIIMPGADLSTFRIELFESRNLSSFLHELSHQWLEDLRADAQNPDAPEQVKADWQAVTEWFAANGNPIVDGVIPVEAHEMWARGGERYLMEGKAPSPALTGLFETFRGWLLSIYKTVQALRAPITPEIREVFDRLLATDEEIAAMAEMQALQPMFKDAVAIGITGQEFEAYKAQAQAARDEANSTLLSKTMAAIRRRETKKFRDEKRAVMADEAERLNDEPLLKSIRLMQATPIDQEWLVDRMGADVLSLLPKRVPPLWRERGVNPDSLAELAGFGSGQQMIEVLIGAERQHRQAREGGDQRTLRARMIENAADAEMTRRYGDDPLNDGSIEQEAIAAVNGELQGELLASEVRLLSRRTGQRPTPYKIARQWARNRVRTGLVSVEASPGAIQRHARNVAKAGRDAEKAMLAGKMDEALRFKQQQMLSSALLAEAKEASDEVNAAVKRLSSVARNRKRDSIDPDYWDQAQAVLAGYDFAPRTEKLMREREGFEKWAAARIAEGEEIQIPERMVTPGTNYTRMTVEQIMGIDDTIKSILHLGRRKKELLLGKERRDWHEARGEWLNGAETLPERPSGPDRNASPSKVRGLISNLIRIDMMAKVMDGGDPNGLMTRIFANGAKAADNTYARLQKTVLEPIADAYMAMKGSRLFDRVSAPEWIDYRTGRPQVFMRSDLLAIAANLGNESSLHKMLAGEALLFKGQEELAPTLEGVTAMLNRELNEAEWQMVITGWRRVEMMGEEAFAAERELTGLKPEKIEPRMVETPLGMVEGGYWPAVYDPDAVRAADAGVNLDAFKGDDFDALIGKNGIGTNKGYTISRTDFVAPMLLNYEAVLFGHVNQVAKRVAYQAWAKNALKVIRDRRVKAMWARKLGEEYHAQLEPWLRDTINQGQIAGMGHLSAVDNILRAARMNMTAMGLVFRATTLIAQVGGLPNSIKAIGAANVAKGFRLYAQDGGAMIARIMDASPLMARRLNEFDRDQAAALAAMKNPPTTEIGRKLKPVADARDKFNAAGFHLIGAIQLYTVDLPTWAGAYDKAMRSSEDGGLDLDHDAAVDYADRMVEEAQGAGRAAQLSAIQRAGEMSRIVTLFYTFFGTVMNYQWEMTQDIRGGKYRKAAVSAGWIMVVAPLIGALIGDAIRGNLPDDDDDDSWLAWAMRKVFFGMFSGVPIVRDVANQAERKAAGEYAPDPATPWQRIASAVGGAGKDTFAAISQTDSYQLLQNNAGFLPEPTDASDKWLKHGIEAVGFATGTGLGQVATTAQFAKEMGNGDADPDGASQIAQGLITGKLKD